MNRKLVTAAAAAVIMSVTGCAKSVPGGDVEYPEYYVACYKGDKFVKMDDDCHDDGLTVGPRPKHVKIKPSFKPQPTTGTNRTTTKPVTGATKKSSSGSSSTGIGSSKKK